MLEASRWAVRGAMHGLNGGQAVAQSGMRAASSRADVVTPRGQVINLGDVTPLAERPLGRLIYEAGIYAAMSQLATSGSTVRKMTFSALDLATTTRWAAPVVTRTLGPVFCAGETLDDAMGTAVKLAQKGVGGILDYAMEGVSSAEAAEKGRQVTVKMIQSAAGQRGELCQVAIKLTTYVDAGVLARWQSLDLDERAMTAEDQAALSRVQTWVTEFAVLAAKNGVTLMVDAEQTEIQGAIQAMTRRIMPLVNQHRAVLYETHQMYLVDGLNTLEASQRLATDGDYKLGVKLVRGAYTNLETAHGRRSLILPTKADTDLHYNNALCMLLTDPNASFLVATHNVVSVEKVLAQHSRGSEKRFSFGQLLGMQDTLSSNLARHGFGVFKYLPWGPRESTIPYLLRRAAENADVLGSAKTEASHRVDAIGLKVRGLGKAVPQDRM